MATVRLYSQPVMSGRQGQCSAATVTLADEEINQLLLQIILDSYSCKVSTVVGVDWAAVTFRVSLLECQHTLKKPNCYLH